MWAGAEVIKHSIPGELKQTHGTFISMSGGLRYRDDKALI